MERTLSKSQIAKIADEWKRQYLADQKAFESEEAAINSPDYGNRVADWMFSTAKQMGMI